MFEIYKIISWHKKTFKSTSSAEQLDKVKSEINEYSEAVWDYTQARSPARKFACKRHADEELIDVIISSINCMRYPEIRERVKVKMEINKHRTFKNNHHIGG